MVACLHVVLALVTSIDKTILSLVVQFNEHAHGAPLAPPEGAELPVLVPCQSQEGITAIHQVTGEQWVGVHDGRQSVDHGPRMKVNHEEHLKQRRGGKKIKIKYDLLLLFGLFPTS